MSLTEKYLLLFIDTFHGNFALSVSDGFAFGIMSAFGYPLVMLIMVVICAALAAGGINYLLGRIIYNICFKYAGPATKARYETLQQIWEKYYLLGFILCIAPLFAKLWMVVCGILRFSFWRSIILLTVFRAIYYLM